jgi:hypothetical protein
MLRPQSLHLTGHREASSSLHTSRARYGLLCHVLCPRHIKLKGRTQSLICFVSTDCKTRRELPDCALLSGGQGSPEVSGGK